METASRWTERCRKKSPPVAWGRGVKEREAGPGPHPGRLLASAAGAECGLRAGFQHRPSSHPRGRRRAPFLPPRQTRALEGAFQRKRALGAPAGDLNVPRGDGGPCWVLKEAWGLLRQLGEHVWVTQKQGCGGRAPTPSPRGARGAGSASICSWLPRPSPSGSPAPTPSMAPRVKPGPGTSPSPPPPPWDQHTVPMETKQKRGRPPPCPPCPASLAGSGLRAPGRAPGCGVGNGRPWAPGSAVIWRGGAGALSRGLRS